MICAQTIVHFRPKAVYEKYLKLLLGIMILIQLVTPMQGYFSSAGNFLSGDSLEFWKPEEGEIFRTESILGEEVLEKISEIREQEECVRESGGSGEGIRIAPIQVEVKGW